ncbi:MAG: glycosyltransferase [Bacteroidia bacterium]|nr:glycosyltransferase [Bacteroidia bacterium]
MQLSVIIVNYNVKHFLEQCLLSVEKAMMGLEAEVFVVDNNSVDGSQQMVAEKFPWVQLIDNQVNVGFSTANNQAIRISNGKYVLLLNPDTVVEEETFHKVVNFMEETPKAGALGVKMIDGQGKFLPESKRGVPYPWVAFYKIFGISRLFPKSKRFGRYYATHLSVDENNPVEVLSGAFMLLRKEALDKVGLLDETFFMYGEDIDLSYRVIQGGYENYYFADTQIIHYKGESTKKGSLNYVRVFYNAMIIFAKKHFHSGGQQLFILLIHLAIYFRASIAVLNRLWKKIAFPLMETALIYGAIFGIKEYWEFRANYIEGEDGQYPLTFDLVAAPIYSVIFVFFLWSFGAYKKPFRIRPILTAGFSGFIAIATVSYIFKDINFSRAIVGLSSIATIFLALTTRGLINLLDKGNFFFTEEARKRAVIVGDEEEGGRIRKLIRGELNYPVEVLGTVLTGEIPQTDSYQNIGQVAQLGEIISVYKVDEVIFSNKSLSFQRIINIMAGLENKSMDYKIVPSGADYLVGPQVIHSSLYSGFSFNLARKDLLAKKRSFDLLTSIFLLLIYPLTFWLYRKPGKALRNLWNVLRGEYHLVGYIRLHPEGLPEIKQGVLNMLHRVHKRGKNTGDYSAGLDRHYARSYSPELDLEILLKGFRYVGGN